MFTSASTDNVFRALYTDVDGIDCSAGIALLEAAGIQVSSVETNDADRIAEAAQGVDALLIGYATVDRALMERLPDLKIIALLSMGYDNVDLEAARERGIWVTNVPGAATEEVATHALALILYLTRGIGVYSTFAREGDWNDRDSIELPRLSNTTLGIVGFGRIGQKLATLAKPLFGEIVAYDPFLIGSDLHEKIEQQYGVRLVSLNELQTNSDVVSLHMPLTEETEHLVDQVFLDGMRPGAYLVNVSRGGLIDQNAMLRAIDSGQLAGAGLDVLETEPAEPGNPLLAHPRVIVTPHVGYLSDASERDYALIQARNVAAYAESGLPNDPLFQLDAAVSGTPR